MNIYRFLLYYVQYIMEFVEPIRDPKKISQIKNMLRWENRIRDLLMFELWINSALRISDLLSIKVSDLFNVNNEIYEFFTLKEQKTGKNNKIAITPKVKETLKLYASTYESVIENQDNYIFFHSKRFPLWKYNLWRWVAWKMINEICHSIWLKWSYGWHTLRKTWWYQARMQWIPLEIIQLKLNHSNLAVTKRYLWITYDEVEKAMLKLDL